MPLPVQVFNFQGPVEPMQIDADPQEDQQNAPDINFVVENPTLDLEQYASSYSGFMLMLFTSLLSVPCRTWSSTPPATAASC
ncbi:COP9 signalosome complex subunit 1-like [Gadus morhua]|uniref:COP9 signalosome complex subunit 1-like n=1 Tax=Gadus morhua TaxID=8049 RepID=UPI0011B5AEB1|nr:COP9 signalosome complex subunit 1-like [Gadus morhua]